MPCSLFGFCIDFSFLELTVKLDSLLLEDQRSEASSKGDKQRGNLLLIIELVQSLYSRKPV